MVCRTALEEYVAGRQEKEKAAAATTTTASKRHKTTDTMAQPPSTTGVVDSEVPSDFDAITRCDANQGNK